jgi:hypothetical protein
MGIPDPTDFAAETYRVLFTFAGVAIAVGVLAFANMLGKRTAPAPA